MKFSFKDFLSKCYQIRSFLNGKLHILCIVTAMTWEAWNYLLKRSETHGTQSHYKTFVLWGRYSWELFWLLTLNFLGGFLMNNQPCWMATSVFLLKKKSSWKKIYINSVELTFRSRHCLLENFHCKIIWWLEQKFPSVNSPIIKYP